MVQSVRLNLGAAITTDSGADITEKSFCVVVKSNDTDMGRTLVEGSNIDMALDYLGTSSIRYPGGTEARSDFLITDPDDIAGLKRAIDYCAVKGMSLNFTLNDTIYVDAASGEATMTAQQRAELQSFLTNDLIGYAYQQGVEIESIKLGNEFTGRTSDYGAPAVEGYSNVAALLVNEIDAILDVYAPGSGYARPGIVVEAGGWTSGAQKIVDILTAAGAASKVDGIDIHGNENGAYGTPTLDLTWDHYFGTAQSDEPGVSYEQRLSRIIDIWTASAPTAAVELRVDAWSFPTTDEGPALTNAALAVLQMHSFSLLGITSATNYIGYGPDQSALIRRVNGDGTFDLGAQTTAGGAMFSMMATALRSTHAIRLASTLVVADEATEASMTRAFSGSQKLVLYTASRQEGDLEVDLATNLITGSLEAFIGGVKSGSTQILGVTNPELTALRQGEAQIEASTLTAAQLESGTASFHLDSHEIAQIILQAAGTFGTNAADSLTGNSSNNTLHGLDGADTILGGGGYDKLAGGAGSDLLSGNDGFDTLYGGAGSDTLDGGQGRDTASYAFANAGVIVSLLDASSNTGDALGDIYSSVENLEGSQFADVLTGNASANTLYGGDGSDNLGGGDGNDALYSGSNNDWIRGNVGDDTENGGDGNDTIAGGSGIDQLSGGSGNDGFLYYFKSECGDSISDYGSNLGTNDDMFSISAAGFEGGLKVGVLASKQFVTRAQDNMAQDSNDRFIFRLSDKSLWFDSNGSAAGDAILIANLQDDAANLVAADIWMF